MINFNIILLILIEKILVFRVHKNGTGPYENKCLDTIRFPYELEYFDHYLPDGSERNQQPETDVLNFKNLYMIEILN